MRRRALLASAAGSIAALPGCLDGGSVEEPTPTQSPTSDPTDDGTPTATPGADADVTVDSVAHQYGYVSPTTPDSIGTRNDDTAFVLVELTVDGQLAWNDIELAVGERTTAPEEDPRLYRTTWGEETYYGSQHRSGFLLFERGAVEADDDVALQWPGGEHVVEGDVRARMNGLAPSFSATVETPAEHEGADGPESLAVEVTNDADRAARFVGALNRAGPAVASTPVTPIHELFDAGATRTISIEDSWGGPPPEERVGDGEADVTYRLFHSWGSDRAEVRIVGSEN